MDWLQVLTIIGSFLILFSWSRSKTKFWMKEMHSELRDVHIEILEIRKEMKNER